MILIEVNEIIIYSILSFLLTLICALLSYRLNLTDLPGKRKIHYKPIANTGGIAISIIYLFSLQIFDSINIYLSLIISTSFLISIVGFIDDRYQLNTGGKLSLQIIPIFYLIFIKGISLSTIGNYDYFNLELDSFAAPFSLLCVLFLVNAFNYFDGIDGTLSFAIISVIVNLFILTNDNDVKYFLLIILIPIFIFLFFNFSQFNLPKMFLGDSGSLLLGFIISFLIIYYADQKISHAILLAWSIVIFVYEFLSINLERIINKKNPFKPGLDHLHHKLFKKTKSIFLTNIIISFINFILFIFGFFTFKFISPLASLFLFIFLFFIFYNLRQKNLIVET